MGGVSERQNGLRGHGLSAEAPARQNGGPPGTGSHVTATWDLRRSHSPSFFRGGGGAFHPSVCFKAGWHVCFWGQEAHHVGPISYPAAQGAAPVCWSVMAQVTSEASVV